MSRARLMVTKEDVRGERNCMKRKKRTVDWLPTVRMGECLGSFRRRVQDKWAAVEKNRFTEKHPIGTEQYVRW